MGHEVFIQKINLFKSPSIAYNSAGCWLKKEEFLHLFSKQTGSISYGCFGSWSNASPAEN